MLGALRHAPTISQNGVMSTDYRELPEGLPVPVDDGAADHLPGSEIPAVTLPSTLGGELDLAAAARERLVVCVYPRTGTPGEPLPRRAGTTSPARAAARRRAARSARAQELAAAGAHAHRLSARRRPRSRPSSRGASTSPSRCSATTELRLAAAMGLPTFETSGLELYKRLTFVAEEGRIVKVFYPVFPPDRNADEVLAWLAPRE